MARFHNHLSRSKVCGGLIRMSLNRSTLARTFRNHSLPAPLLLPHPVSPAPPGFSKRVCLVVIAEAGKEFRSSCRQDHGEEVPVCRLVGRLRCRRREEEGKNG